VIVALTGDTSCSRPRHSSYGPSFLGVCVGRMLCAMIDQWSCLLLVACWLVGCCLNLSLANSKSVCAQPFRCFRGCFPLNSRTKMCTTPVQFKHEMLPRGRNRPSTLPRTYMVWSLLVIVFWTILLRFMPTGHK
jgi:hypothetical protein